MSLHFKQSITQNFKQNELSRGIWGIVQHNSTFALIVTLRWKDRYQCHLWDRDAAGDVMKLFFLHSWVCNGIAHSLSIEKNLYRYNHTKNHLIWGNSSLAITHILYSFTQLFFSVLCACTMCFTVMWILIKTIFAGSNYSLCNKDNEPQV